MINAFTTEFASYLPAALGLIVFVFMIVLTIQNRHLSSKLKEQSEQLSTQQKELSMVSSASVGMGQRLSALQASLNTFSNSDHNQNAPESDMAYARALRLLDNNADETTIMANSGLSQSEIRLMQLVNRPKETV